MVSSPSAACLLLALVVLAGGWVDAHSATRRLLETSAPGPSPVSTEVAPADWCNQCGNVTDYEPVCGSDGQVNQGRGFSRKDPQMGKGRESEF